MNSRVLLFIAVVVALFGLSAPIVVIDAGLATGLAAGAAAGAVTTAAALTVAHLFAGAVVLGALSRGKRDTFGGANSRTCVPFTNPEIYFKMAVFSDGQQCGQRYVCELEATPVAELVQEELMLRSLFGLDGLSRPGSASEVFLSAGQLGATEGIRACATAFSSCPFDRKAIFRALQKAMKGE